MTGPLSSIAGSYCILLTPDVAEQLPSSASSAIVTSHDASSRRRLRLSRPNDSIGLKTSLVRSPPRTRAFKKQATATGVAGHLVAMQQN